MQKASGSNRASGGTASRADNGILFVCAAHSQRLQANSVRPSMCAFGCLRCLHGEPADLLRVSTHDRPIARCVCWLSHRTTNISDHMCIASSIIVGACNAIQAPPVATASQSVAAKAAPTVQVRGPFFTALQHAAQCETRGHACNIQRTASTPPCYSLDEIETMTGSAAAAAAVTAAARMARNNSCGK